MNLEELRGELLLIIQDQYLGTYTSYLTSWINSAVLEIANDFALPALKLNDPVTLTVTKTDWLYDMPSSYQKNLYKCCDSEWNKITIRHSIDDIDSLNIEHDDVNDHVAYVAVRGGQIGIYPKAAEDIKLWYYKKPTDLSAFADELTCIPAQHHNVVITKIILKNLHLFSEKLENNDVAWWNAKYRSEVFGDGMTVGMVNCLARAKRPRRTGGKNPLP